MRAPKFLSKFWHSFAELTDIAEHKYPLENGISYSGSTEESEIQFILQKIVTSSLDSRQCTDILITLRDKLEASSSCWADRFVIGQGALVLHKLLADINTENRKCNNAAGREFVLVQCFSILYNKSIVAKELVTYDSKEEIMKTLLRSLLSPQEDTRKLVAQTLMSLKHGPGSPSKVLHTLTLARDSST